MKVSVSLLLYKELGGEYFLALFKDNPIDTWYNVCFINNCASEIQNIRIESFELNYNIRQDSYEEVASYINEYVNILPGDYLLFEKINSEDSTIDGYRYEITIERAGRSEMVSCFVKRDSISGVNKETGIPFLNQSGQVFLCS